MKKILFFAILFVIQLSHTMNPTKELPMRLTQYLAIQSKKILSFSYKDRDNYEQYKNVKNWHWTILNTPRKVASLVLVERHKESPMIHDMYISNYIDDKIERKKIYKALFTLAMVGAPFAQKIQFHTKDGVNCDLILPNTTHESITKLSYQEIYPIIEQTSDLLKFENNALWKEIDQLGYRKK